jgi:hypothetical protein
MQGSAVDLSESPLFVAYLVIVALLLPLLLLGGGLIWLLNWRHTADRGIRTAAVFKRFIAEFRQAWKPGQRSTTVSGRVGGWRGAEAG